MNKRTVLASLNKIANQLDNEGLHNEADTVTKVMSRLAVKSPFYGTGGRGTSDTMYPGDIHQFELQMEYILTKARANKVGHHSERNLLEQGYDDLVKIAPLTRKLVDIVENSDRRTAEQKILYFIDSRKKDFILDDELIHELRKALDDYHNITDNYFKTSSKTKNMSRLASDMSDFQKDPSGFVGDILDPERKQGDLYGNYMSRHNNNVIDSLNEAIQDMKDDPMISQADINKVIEIKNNLERIYNSDDDMGPESGPFDYSSPEDEGDMYGDDMKGYMDKDSDF